MDGRVCQEPSCCPADRNVREEGQKPGAGSNTSLESLLPFCLPRRPGGLGGTGAIEALGVTPRCVVGTTSGWRSHPTNQDRGPHEKAAWTRWVGHEGPRVCSFVLRTALSPPPRLLGNMHTRVNDGANTDSRGGPTSCDPPFYFLPS